MIDKVKVTLVGGPADGREVYVYPGTRCISIPMMARAGLWVARYFFNSGIHCWQYIAEDIDAGRQ